MAKFTMEELKQSFKDQMKELYTRYFGLILTNQAIDEEILNRIGEFGSKYVCEVRDIIDELGGNSDELTKEWFIEVLNELKLGDVLKEYIYGNDES